MSDKSTDRFEELLTELLIDKIKQIQQDWQEPWFKNTWTIKNLQGRAYSAGNRLLLGFCTDKYKWEYPVFTTFKMAKDENISILRGEKSLPVSFFKVSYKNKETKEIISVGDFQSLSKAEQENYEALVLKRTACVFNIDQTNIREARPDLYEKVTAEYKEQSRNLDESQDNRIDDLVRTQTWFCPILTDLREGAHYRPSSNEVHITPKSHFKSDELFYSTLLHELTHSTGHPDLLDRLTTAKFGSPEYAKEELVAELGSALSGAHYNLPVTLLEDHAAYLKSWLKAIQEEPEFLHAVLSDATKASNMLTTRIDTQEQYIHSTQSEGHMTQDKQTQAQTKPYIIDGANANKQVSDFYLTSEGKIDVAKAIRENDNVVLETRAEYNRSDFDADDLRPDIIEKAFEKSEVYAVIMDDYGTIKEMSEHYDLDDNEEKSAFISSVVARSQTLTSEELKNGVDRIPLLDWNLEVPTLEREVPIEEIVEDVEAEKITVNTAVLPYTELYAHEQNMTGAYLAESNLDLPDEIKEEIEIRDLVLNELELNPLPELEQGLLRRKMEVEDNIRAKVSAFLTEKYGVTIPSLFSFENKVKALGDVEGYATDRKSTERLIHDGLNDSLPITVYTENTPEKTAELEAIDAEYEVLPDGRIKTNGLAKIKEGYTLPDTQDNRLFLDANEITYRQIKGNRLFVSMKSQKVALLLASSLVFTPIIGVAVMYAMNRSLVLDRLLKDKQFSKAEATRLNERETIRKTAIENGRKIDKYYFVDKDTNRLQSIPVHEVRLPHRINGVELSVKEMDDLRNGKSIQGYDEKSKLYYEAKLDFNNRHNISMGFKEFKAEKEYTAVPTPFSPDADKIAYVQVHGAHGVNDIWDRGGVNLERSSFLDKYDVGRFYNGYLSAEQQGKTDLSSEYSDSLKQKLGEKEQLSIHR